MKRHLSRVGARNSTQVAENILGDLLLHNTVGVAIAVHNGRERLCECLESLSATKEISIEIVVVDDGSSDGTMEMLVTNFPEVHAILGTGDLWWAGGTNLAIEMCLKLGCEYVLLLNPDVILDPNAISRLIKTASRYPRSIIAPVVVKNSRPDFVWWAGSQWQPIHPFVSAIWTNRYLFKRGESVNALPNDPYDSSEAHGRGVLVPAELFNRIGLFDAKNLPHYGADTEFSFRAKSAGYRILIAPQVRVRLDILNTGMKAPDSLSASWRGYWDYLTNRKSGEALHVWWHITQRHLTWQCALPTYLAILFWASLRYWQRALRGQFSATSER